MTRKPSIFNTEKRLIHKVPYAIIVAAILITRLLVVLPLTVSTRLFEAKPMHFFMKVVK